MSPVIELNAYELGQLYVAIGYAGMKSLHPDLQDKMRKAFKDSSNTTQDMAKLAVESAA